MAVSAECINDQSGNGVDTGCSADAPLCEAARDEYGDSCACKCATDLADRVQP